MTVINAPQQPLAVRFYLKHREGALSANICSLSGLSESRTQESIGDAVMPH